MSCRLFAVPLLVFALLPTTAEAQAPARARLTAAQRALELATARLRTGQGSTEEVHRWSVRVLESARDADPSQTLPATQAHQARMRAMAATVGRRVDQGMAPALERPAAEYFVAEAQDWVRRGGP